MRKPQNSSLGTVMSWAELAEKQSGGQELKTQCGWLLLSHAPGPDLGGQNPGEVVSDVLRSKRLVFPTCVGLMLFGWVFWGWLFLLAHFLTKVPLLVSAIPVRTNNPPGL